MCPVQHSTPGIPLVLTVVLNRITLTQTVDAWRQIDIVCYQQRCSGAVFDCKLLVPAPFGVTGQQVDNNR